MSWPAVLALVWMVAANVLAMLPSKRSHWPQAWALIAAGVPLLIWIFRAEGPWVGLIALAAGMSVLRWPVRYALAWIRRRLHR